MAYWVIKDDGLDGYIGNDGFFTHWDHKRFKKMGGPFDDQVQAKDLKDRYQHTEMEREKRLHGRYVAELECRIQYIVMSDEDILKHIIFGNTFS